MSVSVAVYPSLPSLTVTLLSVWVPHFASPCVLSLSLSLSLSWEYTGGGGGRCELRNEMKRACAGVVTDCVNHQVARTGRVPRCDWSEARGWEGVGREGHAPETAWARTPARVQH